MQRYIRSSPLFPFHGKYEILPYCGGFDAGPTPSGGQRLVRIDSVYHYLKEEEDNLKDCARYTICPVLYLLC